MNNIYEKSLKELFKLFRKDANGKLLLRWYSDEELIEIIRKIKSDIKHIKTKP